MAKYDPPEPFWRRATAAVYDALLAGFGFSYLLSKAFGCSPVIETGERIVYRLRAGCAMDDGPELLLLVLVIAYFVVLGRTGGTLMQRFFGMKRAKPKPTATESIPSI